MSYPQGHEHSLPNKDPTGQVYLNGTSYSGADIKVLIQTYDTNSKQKKGRIKSLQKTVASAQKSISETGSKLSKIEKKLQQVHSGTSEAQRLSTAQSKYIRQQQAAWKALTNAQSQISEIRKASGGQAAPTKVLAECQTISISTHREKTAVRALGHVYPKGYTRGDRVIAGSLIFTVFNEHVLYQFLDAHASDFDSVDFTSAMLDQIPPVDILISFANEYGSVSRMTIYGVEFMDEGQVMSIEDMLTEHTVRFEARDIDPMRSVFKRVVKDGGLTSGVQMQRASNLLLEEDYRNVKAMVDPFDRFNRRRNPFL